MRSIENKSDSKITSDEAKLKVEAILDIVRPYLKDSPRKREISCIDPFLDLEFETKIDIKNTSDVREILDNVSKLGISKVNHRSEFHIFFSDANTSHGAYVFVDGSPEIWIKQKDDPRILRTPKYYFPILLRREIKIEPSADNYRDVFVKTLEMKHVGSFKKECVDFSFWYGNLSFTATLSLANYSAEEKLYQIEFEFDGYKEGTDMPDFNRIVYQFENMLNTVSPNFTDRLTTHSKLEWLRSIQGKQK